MPPVDPQPAARRMLDLIGRVPDELLDAPTPCSAYPVWELLDHISRVAVNYTAAADRTADRPATPGAWDDPPRLCRDWRTRIPDQVRTLTRAWQDPAAWTGTATRADGCQMPGSLAGAIVLDELTIHGWDLARSLGEQYRAEPHIVEVIAGFLDSFSQPAREQDREGLFGPVVTVTEHASPFERALALSGRDPAWSPR